MNILLISGKYLPIYNKKNKGAIEKLERIYLDYNETISTGDSFTVYSPKRTEGEFDSKEMSNVEFRIVDLTTRRYRIFRWIYVIKKHLLSCDNEFYIREIIKDIKERDEKDKYDLIVFENEQGGIPVFRKKTGTKARIALHLHNDYVNIERRRSREILNSCDEVWCVSQFIEARVKEVKDVKTLIIPNTVEKFPQADKESVKRLMQEVDPLNNVVFLYVGRLLKGKGVCELVDAFNIYNAKNPNSKLILIGEYGNGIYNCAFAKGMRRKICANRNIIPVGYKQAGEISNYYPMAKAQIVPSRCNEAFGLVSLEAMQANVRLIVSEFGAFKEVCRDKAIYVSKENMVRDIVNAMEKVANLEPLPEGYYDDVLKRYSTGTFTNAFYEAIHSCD